MAHMHERRVMGWSAGWSSVLCTLALAACSSMQVGLAPDSAVDADANATPADAGDTMAPASCNTQCSPVSVTLQRAAPPDDCTFALGQVPPDPTNVRLRNGAMTIPQSETDGWVYEPGMMAITLTGSYCVSVRDGTITALTMLLGCPSCPIP
jgi:hypothetical protein